VRAEAAVRAAGETEMVVGLAIDDELVRAVVDPWVPVGAGDQAVDHVARAQRATVELGVPCDLAAIAEDDRVQAQ
jgi:hypothetical protein